MYDVITDRLRVIAYDVKIFRQVKAFDKCVDHERTNRKSEQENSPVSISKIKIRMPLSMHLKSIMPCRCRSWNIFQDHCDDICSAAGRTDVKRIADPSAGRAMAKHNSSIGSSVKGECIGKSRSSTESETERRMLQ